jgi:hypothetical protein
MLVLTCRKASAGAASKSPNDRSEAAFTPGKLLGEENARFLK